MAVTKASRKDVEAIRATGLFDEQWYLEQYPDVRALGMDAAEHYLWIGARLGRNPSSGFDTVAYLDRYADVAKAGINPLLHYSRWGKGERRDTERHDDGRRDTERRDIGRHPEAPRAAEPRGHGLDSLKAVQRIARLECPPAIIVPIYNAPQETEDCIRSVLRHTPASARLILIDDASPDPKIRPLLARYADIPNVSVVHNPANLGFTRTINLGIALAGRADVVFLNSDTKVTPGWLTSLQLAAYSGDFVATATPLSNNAGAFSAPRVAEDNPLPGGLDLDACARLVARGSARRYPSVPTGNGFCMYVRRDCIDEVGSLDAEAFPRGYGEENDFCMRAGRAGWEHVIDDATLIYHVRGASFGTAKVALMEAGRAVVDERYPEYRTAIGKFTKDPDIAAVRDAVGEAWSAPVPDAGVRPRALFVVSTRAGGTPQTNADLMRTLEDRYEPLLLRCDSRSLELTAVEGGEHRRIRRVELSQPLRAFPHTSGEYDHLVAGILAEFGIEIVHIRHIAWHSLSLPRVCRTLGIPVVFSFHDFYTVCPTVKLLDERNVFCGGDCTATPGECAEPLWHDPEFPALKRRGVYVWRASMANMLAACDAFVTTSDSARALIDRHFPEIDDERFVVIPHGRDLAMLDLSRPVAGGGEPIRILAPGNLDVPKGARIIEKIAELDRAGRFEFHVLGNSDLRPRRNLIVHGRYERDQLQAKVEAIAPHIGIVFSIWPETFCHTLTEMWACGLPVAGFDLGAVGSRIREHGGGWLLDEQAPEAVHARLRQIASDPAGAAEKHANVIAWQKGVGRTHTTLWMSHAYDALYRRRLVRRLPDVPDRRPRVGVVVPSLGNASSHVRVLEKIRDDLRRPVRYDVISVDDALHEGTVRELDAILVQRTAIPSEQAAAFVDLCAKCGTKVVFEIDDDLVGMDERRDGRIDYAASRPAVATLLSGADVVVASTETLRQRLAQHARRVVVSENALSERLWLSPLLPGPALLPPKIGSELRIVYAGTRTHDDDLRLLEEPMRRLQAEHPGVRLHVVGITAERASWFEPVEIPNDCKPYPRFVPWFRRLCQEMDLAVAPLVDTPFNRAKSPLKFYDYAAAGLCGLFSDVEPYRSAVSDGATGLLVENGAAAWAEALRRAVADPELRRRMAEKARAEVIAERGMRKEADRLDAIVLGLVDPTRAAR